MASKGISPIRLHPDFWREMQYLKGQMIINYNQQNFKGINMINISKKILETPSWQNVKRELIEQNRRGQNNNPSVFNVGIRIKKDKRRIFDL